jgi:hypothetical protein
MRKRTPKGDAKDMVIWAQMNNMTAPQTFRHFNVPRSTIYKAAASMGVLLRPAKRRPAPRVVDTK